MHRHRPSCRNHQRRSQHQFVDDRAADLIAGADRQLDKARTREDDHAANGVIGQPALRCRGKPAGQQYATRAGQLHHRTQQCVLAGRQTQTRGVDRGLIGGQPEAAPFKGIRRQLDKRGAGHHGTPIHPDAGYEGLGHTGHQAVRFGTVLAQQRHGHHVGLGQRFLDGPGQAAAGPHFDESGGAGRIRMPDAVGEPDRRPDVAGPVVGRREVISGQRAGHIGDDRNGDRMDGQFACRRFEFADHGFHQRRVEGVRDRQLMDSPALGAQLVGDGGHRVPVARHHH